MTPTPWFTRRLSGFDLETTGTDPFSDRIVTAAVLDIDGAGGRETATRTWLLNPGVSIPDEAAAVHGVTTLQAREGGQDAAQGVAEIARALLGLADDGATTIAMNASYDLTLLASELHRHGHPGLAGQIEQLRPVVDPKILDKQADRYRKGSRKLVDVARHYKVELSEQDAHGAEADALAAVRVAYRIGARHAWIGQLTPDRLHDLQVDWAEEQARSLKAHWEKHDDPRAGTVNFGWPILTEPAADQP
ncbi:DNA polymerase-3 subunit epsilon [Nocardiopsis mwathae]|uniref:DNA polymerase-3 subunit epsilon n=1 Tax=Nocardiopsis mwathae TaxID=1472723 RepID=A0A7W9YHF5_9ACTN|nr:exonuclease domain-containing protein [Nocardiopsis mwathae]MBB6172225.1 DNA polymerase-3 subunit epsilon [Nocardiopsis mwathae]